MKNYTLVCQECGGIVETDVEYSEVLGQVIGPTIYKAMNALGWALVPSQHNERVKGICPKCRVWKQHNAARRGDYLEEKR